MKPVGSLLLLSIAGLVATGPEATGAAEAAAHHRLRRASRRCGAEGGRRGGAVGRHGPQGEVRRDDQRRRRPFRAGRRSARPAAARRKSQECARILGIETRRARHPRRRADADRSRIADDVARLIRDWQADIVMGHRPYDYHPDHRYTGVLMDDAAVVVVAPFFVPDTTPTPRNPLFFYYSDGFEDPEAVRRRRIVVDIDAAAEKKWQCVSAMPSQFGDKDSWQGAHAAGRPEGRRGAAGVSAEPGQAAHAAVADQYRDRLVAIYGEERGRKVQVRRGVSARAVRPAGVG